MGTDLVDAFIADGYVLVEGAFSSELAAACVDVLWTQIDADRSDPATWTEPVVRVPGSADAALTEAINAPRLTDAIDAVVGVGRWQRRGGYGSFPIRFPSLVDPGDAGWHIDGSFERGPEPPPWNLHVNLRSRGRALLLLLLFSDVTEDDAPTRIRVGSHLDTAATLADSGPDGVGFAEVVASTPAVDHRPIASATGRAGDVYLCHPFLVHAASWPHRGEHPRFVGQPCIHHTPGTDEFDLTRPAKQLSACERAIVAGLRAAGLPTPPAPR